MRIKQYVKRILNLNENTKIAIYGGGVKGGILFDFLSSNGFDVYAFVDNDKEKQRKGVRGVQCFSEIELLDKEATEDLCILISPNNSEELYESVLKKFNKVFPSEIVSILCNLEQPTLYPLGHFYSLYPDLKEIKSKESEIFDGNKKILDIDLREDEQMKLLDKIIKMYPTIPQWKRGGKSEASDLRYQYDNSAFSPADAIILHGMLRTLCPKKMIEVGSGWSSAVTLDTNEFNLNNSIDLTFIEPYPRVLKSLLKENDDICLIEKPLQEVPVKLFEELDAGDLLFIDSTHVSKVGSDVNYLFFEIFPRLKRGVTIHLHDIFYPFEYPDVWILNGMIWNELYLLRAFLQNNKEYEIIYFQNMIEKKYSKIISEIWPLEIPFFGGSIYLKKV